MMGMVALDISAYIDIKDNKHKYAITTTTPGELKSTDEKTPIRILHKTGSGPDTDARS